MQSMPGLQGVASGRELSAGAVLVFCGGLGLFQMTSMVLGPASSRQLNLSLTIPAVDVQDLSGQLVPDIKVVVGTRATPAAAAPSSGATRISTSSRGSSTPTPRVSTHPALPLPIPSPRVAEGQGVPIPSSRAGEGQGVPIPSSLTGEGQAAVSTPAPKLHDED